MLLDSKQNNVRDDHHGCVTVPGFTEAKYFSRDETTHDHSHGILNDLQQEPMLTEPYIAAKFGFPSV